MALAALGRGRVDVTITEGALSVTDVPVLHIIGSRDTPARLEAAERLKEVLPSVDSLVIEGATHAGSTGAYNQPEFVEAIASFVNRHSVQR